MSCHPTSDQPSPGSENFHSSQRELPVVCFLTGELLSQTGIPPTLHSPGSLPLALPILCKCGHTKQKSTLGLSCFSSPSKLHCIHAGLCNFAVSVWQSHAIEQQRAKPPCASGRDVVGSERAVGGLPPNHLTSNDLTVCSTIALYLSPFLFSPGIWILYYVK